MSYTTALGITPNQRPQHLAEFRNSWGWCPTIWHRLLKHQGVPLRGRSLPNGPIEELWDSIEHLPEWQQAPLVLTFDTGIIPAAAYQWAAEQLEEFEHRLPEAPNLVNHVPAMAKLLRSNPDTPWFGIWGTSGIENPFDP